MFVKINLNRVVLVKNQVASKSTVNVSKQASSVENSASATSARTMKAA